MRTVEWVNFRHIFTSVDSCYNNQEECCDLVLYSITIDECELMLGKNNLNPWLVTVQINAAYTDVEIRPLNIEI